jgi:bacterioferritin
MGSNLQKQLETDLKDEAEAVHTYNAAIQVCGEALDDGSSELFKSLLLDEKKHADFLEAQLTVIQAAMGLGKHILGLSLRCR